MGAKTYYFGTTGVMNSRFTKSVSADLRKVITRGPDRQEPEDHL
ncbi:MAG: hypothetical protein ACLR6B_13840 [Blautia sp.]